MGAPATGNSETCLWTESLDCAWTPGCNKTHWRLDDGLPSDAGYIYCPTCGKPIEAKPLLRCQECGMVLEDGQECPLCTTDPTEPDEAQAHPDCLTSSEWLRLRDWCIEAIKRTAKPSNLSLTAGAARDAASAFESALAKTHT